MRTKKKIKRLASYIPLSDIEKIDDAFLNEINKVNLRLTGCDDKELIDSFYNVLMSGYKAAIELKTLERAVDYNIKFAEIEARRRKLKPWRRCALWRLLFQPLTNRAQDIIDERAKVDADSVHTEAENAINADRKRLLPDGDKKLSKRELKCKMRKKLKAALKKADAMKQSEVFYETPESAAAPMNDTDPAQEQPQAQELPPTSARRPRPPRSCRRPATPGQ